MPTINMINIKKSQLESLKNKSNEISKALGFDDGDGSLRYANELMECNDDELSDFTKKKLSVGDDNLYLIPEFIELAKQIRILEEDIYYMEHPSELRFGVIDDEYRQKSQFNDVELDYFMKIFHGVPPVLEKCKLYASINELGKAFRGRSTKSFSSDKAAAQELIDTNFAMELPSGRYLDRSEIE